MSRLTDVFDDWVEIVRECYVSAGICTDEQIAANPGASEEELEELEREIGHPLAPEVRELYQHANGMDHSVMDGIGIEIFPGQMSFFPIDQPRSNRRSVLNLIDIIRAEAPHGALGPSGLPLLPYALFESDAGQVYVECSKTGAGAVSFIFYGDTRFYWVARSLTSYLEIQVEAFRNGGITWDAQAAARFKVIIDSDYAIGARQAGELTAEQASDRRFTSNGEWRWPE